MISGQDIVLDMLSKYIETHTSLTPLRLYNGSLNSLVSMYNGECDVVSVHLMMPTPVNIISPMSSEY